MGDHSRVCVRGCVPTAAKMPQVASSALRNLHQLEFEARLQILDLARDSHIAIQPRPGCWVENWIADFSGAAFTVQSRLSLCGAYLDRTGGSAGWNRRHFGADRGKIADQAVDVRRGQVHRCAGYGHRRVSAIGRRLQLDRLIANSSFHSAVIAGLNTCPGDDVERGRPPLSDASIRFPCRCARTRSLPRKLRDWPVPLPV